MPAGDRIEAFAVEIGHLDRCMRRRRSASSAVSFKAAVNDARLGMNVDQKDVHFGIMPLVEQ